MNDVLGRIAELQARFAPAPARPASTGSAEFSSVLASAQSTSATRAGASTANAEGVDLTNALGALSGAAGIDTTSFASLRRLLQSSQPSVTANSSATSSVGAGAIPAAYGDLAAGIDQVAVDEGVPASLLAALVWSESSFNPDAQSPAGARGLTQLMPATAAGLGVNIDDPADNLRGGARYLRQMLDRFSSTDLALAAYNAGPNAVARANGIPNYPETQNYVTRVMARAATLAGANA